MQQITALSRITRRFQHSGHFIGLSLLCLLVADSSYARGPHHPRGGVKSRAEQQQDINEHLAVESHHIEDDLKAQGLPDKKVEELSEEERNYLFFKVHDLDGNDKLDGLEIYYSATHHHSVYENEDEQQPDQDLSHNHEHNDNTETNAVSETAESTDSHDNENNQPSNDSTDATNLKLLELDEDGQIVNKNFNHIIDVLDNFLNLADLNNDGYLNYAEYAAAVKLGNEMVETEQHPEL